MLKPKTFLRKISILIATGILFSIGILPVISRAGNGGALPGSSVPAGITPEIREILQNNNLQAARYKTAAPDFELRDLDGKPVRLSQLRGEIVLLGFFTTW